LAPIGVLRVRRHAARGASTRARELAAVGEAWAEQAADCVRGWRWEANI